MDWAGTVTLSVPLSELVLRGSITYLLLYILIRVVGRRESAAVGLTDVLLIVLIADAASTGMLGDSETIADGFLVIVVIIFWSVLIDAVSYQFPWFAKLAKARPKPLIKDGTLVRSTMKREFMTHDEVMTQLRMHGIGDPSEVQRAYLEPNGSISIVTEEEAKYEREHHSKSPAKQDGDPGDARGEG